MEEIFAECCDNLYTSVDVLGFEFEMGLNPYITQEFKEKGQVKFYDGSFLSAKTTVKGNKASVTLVDFITGYTQETWTGNYIFENEWQSFRTRKNKEIEH